MSVRRSLAWTYLAQAANFLIALGSSIIVARLVSPRDFGIFAMAAAVTAIINVFMQLGLAKYVMREPAIDRDLLRSLFTVNAALTACYVGAILIGAIVADRLADSSEVAHFLLVFALFPFIAMLEFVPSALCAREMKFGIAAAISVLRAVALAGTTIWLAMLGFAYMSFAWAAVVASAATAIAYNLACWRPDVWKPRITGFRAIASFGAEMAGIGGLSQLSNRGGEMALGSMLGLANLGLYARASSLPAQLHANLYGVGSNVIFSRLSKDLREQDGFHDTYLRFMRIILGALWPLMLSLAVLAQPLVHFLYGSKWQGAATPLAILMLSVGVTLGIGMSSEVFILRRQTRRQLKIESVRAGLGFVLFLAGALISVPAAAAAKLIEATIAYILYRRPMDRLVGAPPGRLRAVYAESVFLAAVATLPACLVMIWSNWSPTASISQLLGALVLGTALWTWLVVWRRHPISEEGQRLFRMLRTQPN